MKINFQKLPFLLAIAFLVFSSGLFYFLYNKIQDNHTSIKEINIKIKEEESYMGELRALGHGIKTIESEKLELEKHFVSSSNFVPFLDTIENLALKVGATAETTSVDISQDKLNLTVDLDIKGSFVSLYKFITLLENSSYELEVVSLDLFKETTQMFWEVKIVLKLISFVN